MGDYMNNIAEKDYRYDTGSEDDENEQKSLSLDKNVEMKIDIEDVDRIDTTSQIKRPLPDIP